MRGAFAACGVALVLLEHVPAAAVARQEQVSTRHLDLNTYPSPSAVSLGTRVSLVVEVTPRKGLHVYAPGASKYRVISLVVDPQPRVRLGRVRYPKSEMYHFVPLNERVPTYQTPFTLTLDVVPDATAEGRKVFAGRTELVLNGTLEYQACDDKVCYNPVSLPLSWTVGIKRRP